MARLKPESESEPGGTHRPIMSPTRLQSDPSEPPERVGRPHQAGLVVALRGAKAWLEWPSARCQRCAVGKGCGAGLLGRQLARRLRVDADPRWRLGDRVTLPDPGRWVSKSAALIYGAPVVGLLAGMGLCGLACELIALSAPGSDLLLAAGGMAGALMGSRQTARISSATAKDDCPL